MFNPKSFELTLEQQFLMYKIESEVQSMSKAQMQEMLLEMSKQLMLKDNIFKDHIKSMAKKGCLL